ncbi:MAG: long-chain fatty acid--CoA ligase [Polyangiaceae bacterium]
MAFDSIPRRLFEQARNRPEAPAYYAKRGGAYQPTRYREFAAIVRRAARSLRALGVGPGKAACMLGFNRPEWVIFHIAAMATGGAGAGIYTSCSAEEVAYIVNHAEAPVVLVENQAQFDKLKRESDKLPLLQTIVLMQGAPRIDDPRVLTWEEFLAKGESVADSVIDEALDAIEPGGLATLIYTSGTTGPPKGVMLSHQNLAWTAGIARELVGSAPDDRVLSYLPLAHIAEQMFSVHGAVSTGYAVYYAESLEKVPENLKEAEPTLFFGVPRIWEKFHAGISAKMATAKGAKKALAERALAVGRAYSDIKNRGETPGLLLTAQYRFFEKAVYSKVKGAIGLGKARACVSGAAPIAREVLEFFSGLGITVLEVYGQSEDTGPTSFNRPGKTKFGTVGPVIPGVEVKIADDGEILVKGPNVFLGYFKEPAATAETLVDGWLCSGDLGAIDAEGFLSITGRKKEIIITSGGKNITPANIEGALKNHTLVSEAVVIGDRRKFLTAVLTLDPEAAQRFCSEHGVVSAPHESPEVKAEVQRAIDQVNATLAKVETIKKFTILPRAFTVETGELTPSLKVKRRIVAKNFANEIEAMYAE